MQTIRFNHPNKNIPMTTTWDVKGELVLFDFADYDTAAASNAPEIIDEIIDWCIWNAINCYSCDQANRHLSLLGIKERFK